MKKWLTSSKIRLIFIAAFLFVSAFLLVTYINMRNAQKEIRNVGAALDALRIIENILVNVQAIETGQRGFTISGDEKFLDSYYKSLKNIQRDTALFAGLPLPGTQPQKKRRALIDLVNRKVRYAKMVVESRRIYGYDSAAVKIQVGEGKLMMDSIITLINSIENRDRAFLRQSNFDREKYAGRIGWQFIVLALLFYIILIYSFLTIYKDFRRLERSEKLLKYNATLIGNISDPIITTDASHRITNWNTYAEKLYGYLEKEVLGRKVKEVLDINYEGLSIEKVREEFNKHDFWKGEVIHHHKLGHPIQVEVSTSAIRDEEGNDLGTVAVIRDITQRKAMEQQLNELTATLQQRINVKSAELNNVFERITDAFMALDNNWNYVYVNKKAAEMHGREPAELIGANIWEQYPDVKKEPFYHALMKARETQQPQRMELYYSTQDRWFEDLIYPSADGISIYYHDITETKKASLALEASREALKVSSERFLLVAKATNDAVWDWDMEADTIWGNEVFRRMYGLKAGELFNFKDFVGRIHEEDRQVIMDNFKKALRNKDSFITEEFRMRANDGSYRVLYDRANIIYKNNMAVRMLGAMEDITEEIEYKRKLVLEKELSDSIINSLPGVFYLYNQQGKFYRWNKNFEKVTGYSAEEIVDLPPTQLFEKDAQALLTSKIANVFLVGEDNMEAKLLSKSGQLTPYYFTGRVIQYEGETCLMGVGMDISERVRAQQELKNSEEKFRTLIDQASDGIFISNQQGDYQDVNTSATLLTGYSKEELLKMNTRDIIALTDQQNNAFSFDELHDGQVIISERMIRQKNGNIIDVEISSKILPDGRYQAIVRDITARKKAEVSIRQSEEQRRLIMNAAMDAIICMDTQGLVTFWNPRAEAVFGWKAAEVYGNRLSAFIIPIPFRQMHEKGLQKYLATGKGPSLNVLLELTAINKDQHEFPVEITILPIKQESGEFFCAFVRDITERKKAEEEIRLSEIKYRLLFTQNPMPMWMISMPERDFMDVNPAAIDHYGYSREEFLNMNIRDIRPPEEIPKVQSIFNRFPQGINNTGVWIHRKKNGELIHVNIITHDIVYEGRDAKLVLANDITEKIIAEDNLRKSHEEFRQLATHLENIRESERTHMAREIHDELGQQLTGLKMDISWLNKKIQTDDKDIKQKIEETIQLIDKTVITVRRIATELRPSILDDLGLIAAMEWQSEEFERRSEIKTTFKSNTPAVLVSPGIATGLFRIYQECLTNVVRHAAATKVTASLMVDENTIELLIKDNGKGFNASGIENKKTLGILGMKERTLLMGGSYDITSTPGKGTSVRIIVPLR